MMKRGVTLVGCLERALHFFVGVPNHVLCDNPKTIVTQENPYGEGLHRYQSAWLDFTKHYGLGIKRCPPYRAQTKGKIERFHRYLRESFYNPLQTVRSELIDVALANREVRFWLDEVADRRVHATLKERPVDRFAFERLALKPLPLPYGGRQPATTAALLSTVLTPIESIQHPLSVYDLAAKEIRS
jgi:transposase